MVYICKTHFIRFKLTTQNFQKKTIIMSGKLNAYKYIMT